MPASFENPKFAVVARRGSKGSRVTDIQQKLNDWALAESIPSIAPTKSGLLKEDGSFGSNTETAVKNFQNRGLLLIDGVVGPFTYAVLAKEEFVIDVSFDGRAVVQSNARKCWAAATEYWLKHQPAFPIKQDIVIEEVRKHVAQSGAIMDDAVLPSGALTFRGMEFWQRRFLLKGISEISAGLTAELAAQRLLRSGKPLMMGDIEFDSTSKHFTVGHVRVLLGVQCSFMTPDDFAISFAFMDPLFIPHFRSIKLSELQKGSSKSVKREFMTWVDFGASPS